MKKDYFKPILKETIVEISDVILVSKFEETNDIFNGYDEEL